MAHDTMMDGMARQIADVAMVRGDEVCIMMQCGGDGMQITTVGHDAVAAAEAVAAVWCAGSWDAVAQRDAVEICVRIIDDAWTLTYRAHHDGLPERCSRMAQIVRIAHDAARRLCVGSAAGVLRHYIDDSIGDMYRTAANMDRECMANYGAAWRSAGRPYQG